MRNLQLLNRVAVGGSLTDVLCLALDFESGVTFAATSTEIVAIDTQSGEILKSCSILPDGASIKFIPVGLEYIFDQRAVCIATSDGRLCLWQHEIGDELEVVGDVPQGITAMAWSPDFELLILSTGDEKLVMMTSEFDVFTEMAIFPDHQGEDSNIAVGWGKKETQFHGSAGKQAAKVELVEVQPASEKDNGLPKISWRGDGQFFAVSAIDSDTGSRSVFTWSRECVFQAKSEAVDGLQHSLCWKPSGALIASVQTRRQTKVQDVIFFEKNGLRHGEFTIPPFTGQDFCVQEIMWNQDSTILALRIDVDNGNQKPDESLLQLWTVNNYHWYLKQNLRFKAGIAAARWDLEQAYKMHVMTRAGQLVTHVWSLTTHNTQGTVDRDLSLVAVIDGAQILVTPMRKMLVPPPMAAFTIKCSSPVNGITFDPCPTSNDIMAYLSMGEVAVYSFSDSNSASEFSAASGDVFKPILDQPVLKATYHVRIPGHEVLPTELSHLLWVSESRVLMAAQGKAPSTSILILGTITSEEDAIVGNDTVAINSVILNMAFNQATKNVAVQLTDGKLFKFESGTKTLIPWMAKGGEAKFPSPCTQIALACVGDEEVVLGLTERFRFFVNDIEVASNCTSFGVHNDFLLLTTLSHTLRCLPTVLKASDLPKLSDEKSHPFDESCRRVERGSRIVSVVGNGTQVVLQMPRGNLETIHPRALLISSLKKLMDRDMIQEAFMMVRKHRINMNLLHDHNPTKFLSSVDNFIQTINNQSYLDVFLTDLVDEDVTCTMYSASYSREASETSKGQNVSKVDTICDAFLEAFQRLGVQRHIQSVLTAHARKTQPELEKALLLVWSLHDHEVNAAEAALKYLLFLVDVNVLYDIALGTYNFDLVMMVAQKSQKDPKEYIPFLNQLRRLEDNYRYYSIDKYLKKYSKALEHISKCGDDHFDECVSLVSEHKLYRQALQLYKPGSPQFKRLATLYGNYLSTKNRHDEAGVEFIKGEEWEMALESFRRGNDWQQVFCMAHKLEYGKSQLVELSTKLAGELKNRQKYEAAATVLIEYGHDYEEAIVALIEGCHWKEALRQMYRFQRLDLIETHLLEALQESWEHHTEMLSSQRELFERYKNRLQVVRAQKEKAAAALLEGTADFNDADADLFSDTTSLTGASVSSRVTSNSSRSTVFTKGTGSARTRRKADNKRWSLKEGSANEEFALVDAEAKIIKLVDSLKEDISNLLRVLFQFNFDEKASKLQELYSDFLHFIQSAIPEIWIYSQKQHTSTMSLGPNMTANAVAQALQKGHTLQGEEEKLDPVLLAHPVLDKDTRWKLHTSSDQER